MQVVFSITVILFLIAMPAGLGLVVGSLLESQVVTAFLSSLFAIALFLLIGFAAKKAEE